MPTDKLDQLFGIEEIKAQQQQVIAIIDDTVAHITAASKQMRANELFVTDSNTLAQGTAAIKAATAAVDAHKASLEKLLSVKQQEQTLADAVAAVSTQNAKGKKDEADNTTALAQAISALNKERERLTAQAAQEAANARNLNASYEQLKKQYKDASDSAKQLAAAQVLAGTSTDGFNTKTKDAISHAQNLGTQLNAAGTQIAGYQNKVDACKGVSGQFNTVLIQLPKAAENTKGTLKDLSGYIGSFAATAIKAREEGKSWGESLSAIATSSQGITAVINLAIFTIGKLIERYEETPSAIDKAEMANQRYIASIKAIDDQSQVAATNEVARLRILEQVATDETASRKERKAAVDELQRIYPEYLGNLKDETIMSGKAKDKIDELVKSLLAKAVTEQYAAKYAAAKIQQDSFYDAFAESVRKYVEAKDQLKKAKEEGTSFVYAEMGIDNVAEAEKNLKIAEQNRDKIDRLYDGAIRLANSYEKKATEAFKSLADLTDKLSSAKSSSTSSKTPKPNKNVDQPSSQTQSHPSVSLPGAPGADKEALPEETKKAQTDAINEYLVGQKQLSDAEANALKESLKMGLEKYHAQKELRDKNLKEEQAAADKQQKIAERVGKAANFVLDAVTKAHEASSKRKNAALDDESKKIEQNKDDQLKALDTLNISEEEKAARTAKINADAAAGEARIQGEKRRQMAKDVQFERESALAKALVNLYLGVSKEVSGKGVIGIATATAIFTFMSSIIGAITSVKTPTFYAEGTGPGGHKGGDAVVGEKYIAGRGYQKELVRIPGRGSFITDGPAYIPDMPVRSEVIPLTGIEASDAWNAKLTPMPLPGGYGNLAQVMASMQRSAQPTSHTSVIIDNEGIRRIYTQGAYTRQRIETKITR